MWTGVKAIGAVRDDDHDPGEDGKHWKAIVFLGNMIDDPVSLEIGDVTEGALSELSDMIRKDCYHQD